MKCDRCGNPPLVDNWQDEWLRLDGVHVCGSCQALTERVNVLRGMEQVLQHAEAMAAEGGCTPPDERFREMVARERARVVEQVRTARELEQIGGVL